MPDYLKSKIYKIIDNTNNSVYIGSTTKTINDRLCKHVNDYDRYLRGLMNYLASFDIIKNNNYTIELIELYPCKNKIELTMKENDYIKSIVCVNRQKAYRSNNDIKERYKQDAEKFKLNNPEKYKAIQERRCEQIECIVCKNKVSKRNMARHMKSHI